MTVVSAADGRQLAAPARAIVPGLVLASSLALIAGAVSGWLPPAIAPVTISILLGIVVGQLPAARDPRLAPGLAFAAQRVLRLGIVLLGARLSFEQIARIGIPSTIVVVVTMAAALTLVLSSPELPASSATSASCWPSARRSAATRRSWPPHP